MFKKCIRSIILNKSLYVSVDDLLDEPTEKLASKKSNTKITEKKKLKKNKGTSSRHEEEAKTLKKKHRVEKESLVIIHDVCMDTPTESKKSKKNKNKKEKVQTEDRNDDEEIKNDSEWTVVKKKKNKKKDRRSVNASVIEKEKCTEKDNVIGEEFGGTDDDFEDGMFDNEDFPNVDNELKESKPQKLTGVQRHLEEIKRVLGLTEEEIVKLKEKKERESAGKKKVKAKNENTPSAIAQKKRPPPQVVVYDDPRHKNKVILNIYCIFLFYGFV